jgi:prepilin peptidase CpaA
MELFIVIGITIGMTVAAIRDLISKKIPNRLTYPMMLSGLLYHGTSGGTDGLWFSVSGLLLGIGVFLIPYLCGGMGAGDAKLMGAAGALIGSKGVIVAAVISILVGFIYAIILLLINIEYSRSLMHRLKLMAKTFFRTLRFIPIPPGKDEKQPKLSFGLAIALGTMGYVFLKVTDSQFVCELIGIHFII